MEKYQTALLLIPVLLFSMVAHEYAHGWVALKQGDPTARDLGRLTWNPIRHIDPFLTILVPIITWIGSNGTFLFGGAKPIPVDPRNYRHYRRGDILVSLAGVTVNLGLAVLCTGLIALLGGIGRAVPAVSDPLAILQRMSVLGVQINLILVVFNLLPLPPLDGSHVVKHLLPPPLSIMYQRLGNVGMLILVLMLAMGAPVLGWWMRPVGEGMEIALRAVHTFILPSPWTT